MTTGKSQTAEPAAILLTYLWEKGGDATSKQILRDNWKHFDTESFAIIIKTLDEAGLVKFKNSNGEVAYYLTEDGKKIFSRGGK